MKKSEKKYTCAIIDDDRMSIEILTKLISFIPKLTLVKSYTNSRLAICEIKKQVQPLDFLILDIRMEVSGLEVASLLRDEVKTIIFVTGYPEYAMEAFQVYADSFLVKPVEFKKLLSSVNRAIAGSFSIR